MSWEVGQQPTQGQVGQLPAQGQVGQQTAHGQVDPVVNQQHATTQEVGLYTIKEDVRNIFFHFKIIFFHIAIIIWFTFMKITRK